MTKAPFYVFTGRAQSGKTTSANFLVEKGFQRISFADPLKRMLQVLTLTTDKHATPPVLCGKTVREALQTLGTEWGRKLVGEDIWVRSTVQQVQGAIEDLCNGTISGVVIDDCRFDNEAMAMRQLGAVIIKIERESAEVMEHESERGVSDSLVDFTLWNNQDEEHLKSTVTALCGLA
jgi:hypothetical protein